MKKIVVLIALTISIVSCNKPAEVKEIKTAYVDTSVLMKEYTGTKDLDAKYKAKGEEKGRQLQAEIDSNKKRLIFKHKHKPMVKLGHNRKVLNCKEESNN